MTEGQDAEPAGVVDGDAANVGEDCCARGRVGSQNSASTSQTPPGMDGFARARQLGVNARTLGHTLSPG